MTPIMTHLVRIQYHEKCQWKLSLCDWHDKDLINLASFRNCVLEDRGTLIPIIW